MPSSPLFIGIRFACRRCFWSNTGTVVWKWYTVGRKTGRKCGKKWGRISFALLISEMRELE